MKKLTLLLTLIFCMGISAPAFAAEEYAYQSFWAASHPLNKEIWQPWLDGISKVSNGKIVFHYNANNTLVKADAVAAAIKSGNLDAGGIQMQTAVAMMPLSQLIALPFIVQNADEAGKLYRAMYKEFPEMRKEIDKNFELITLIGSDRYAFASVNGFIKKPEDLKGKRVLVWAAYQIDEVKSWGGLPVQVASSETYMGLQRGLGEVAYVPAPALDSNKLSEVAKYLTLIPSRSLPLVAGVNKDAWKSLPKEVQNYIKEEGRDKLSIKLAEGLMALTERDNVKHIEVNKCQLYELSLEEQKPFKELAAASNEKYWIDMLTRNGVKNPKEWIAKVEALAKKTFNR